MKKTLFSIGAALALTMNATPALAAGDDYRIPATVAQADKSTEDERTRRAARRWEAAYVALSAADLAITVSCIEAGKCVEANPIAKNHSTGTMIAIKSALTLGHALFVHRLAKKHPKAALRFAQVSVGVQGAVVGLNIRTVF
jgi:hypothetical protein